MEIRITLNNREMLCIQIGRNTLTSSSIFLITIIREEYDNHRNVIFASIIKGLFRKAKIRGIHEN